MSLLRGVGGALSKANNLRSPTKIKHFSTTPYHLEGQTPLLKHFTHTIIVYYKVCLIPTHTSSACQNVAPFPPIVLKKNDKIMITPAAHAI